MPENENDGIDMDFENGNTQSDDIFDITIKATYNTRNNMFDFNKLIATKSGKKEEYTINLDGLTSNSDTKNFLDVINYNPSKFSYNASKKTGYIFSSVRRVYDKVENIANKNLTLVEANKILRDNPQLNNEIKINDALTEMGIDGQNVIEYWSVKYPDNLKAIYLVYHSVDNPNAASIKAKIKNYINQTVTNTRGWKPSFPEILKGGSRKRSRKEKRRKSSNTRRRR